MSANLTGLIVGLLLGMRHALEPDHLTAVSTLATENPSPRRGAILGAFWGIGHSLSLLCVGVVLALLHAEMPSRLAEAFEMGVGVMLVVLGFRAVVGSARMMKSGDARPHAHGGRSRVHAGVREHVHVADRAFASRALIVGMVHGLAGSGALTAMVLADLPSSASRLAYIALFGAGSVIGMSALSGGIGVPLSRLGRRAGTRATLSAGAGLISIALGFAWGWPLAARFLAVFGGVASFGAAGLFLGPLVIALVVRLVDVYERHEIARPYPSPAASDGSVKDPPAPGHT